MKQYQIALAVTLAIISTGAIGAAGSATASARITVNIVSPTQVGSVELVSRINSDGGHTWVVLPAADAYSSPTSEGTLSTTVNYE